MPDHSASSLRFLLPGLALILSAFFAWFLIEDASREAPPEESALTPSSSPVAIPLASPKQSGRAATCSPLTREDLLSVPNERLIRFQTQDAYSRALELLAAHDLQNLGQLEDLLTLRVGYRDLSVLEDLFGEEELFHNFYHRTPPLPEGGVQPGAVPFGNTALSFLGVTGDRRNYGKGVRVAALDSGITPHLTFGENLLPQINLIPSPDPALQNQHGTTIAGILGGQDPRLPGASPAAEILPIRIIDERGLTNDWLILEGISAARDNGADVLLMSFGGEGYNPVLADELLQLHQDGVAIFAPTGNQGTNQVLYPAGYEGVYGVGAIDAGGKRLDFSAYGPGTDLVAPGLSLQAPYGEDLVTATSGTSISVYAAAGVFVAENSLQENETMVQTTERHLRTANDVGRPGYDSETGAGVPHLDRALRQDGPPVEDLALSSHFVVPPGDETSPPGVYVNIQNRGTTEVVNATITSKQDQTTTDFVVNSLAPNETAAFLLPLGQDRINDPAGLSILTSISSQNPKQDVDPQNNLRQDQVVLPASALPDSDVSSRKGRR